MSERNGPVSSSAFSAVRLQTPATSRRGQILASPLLRSVVGGGTSSSPTFRTPGTGLVPVNDDEAERRQRRLENQLRSMISPGCHTPRSVAAHPDRGLTGDSGTSTFSNAQIAEHYANCIRLSAENKINAKNAFGLHLIDYMAEMLHKRGEMTNFQVAGCTLDASAKIYAGRVDSIYQDAYKMLGGLGRSDRQGGGEGADQNESDGDDQPQQQQQHAKKKSRKSHVQTIEKNVKSLDVNTFDLEFEVDPLFKKTSASFDEGGVEGLLLNQLPVNGDQCTIMLDSTQVPASQDSPPQVNKGVSADLKELTAYFHTVKDFETLQICPTFATFKFIQDDGEDPWDVNALLSDTPSRLAQRDYCPQPDVDYSMLCRPPMGVVSGQPGNDDDDETDSAAGGGYVTAADLGDHGSEGGDTVSEADSQPSQLGQCGDNKLLQQVTLDGMKRPGVAGELCLAEALEVSEYSYFNPTFLTTWAGPHYWKLRPRNRIPPTQGQVSVENTEQTKKKKQPRQPYRIDLTVLPNIKLFRKSRAVTTLTRSALGKRSSSQTTLPEDLHEDPSMLFQLFLRPKWKVKRQRRQAESLEDDPVTGYYDYNNPSDNVNYCPEEADVPYGGDSDEDVQQDSLPVSGEQFMNMLSETVPFYDDSNSQRTNGLVEMDTLPAGEPEQPPLLAGDYLVAQPKKVSQIHIDYARQAKRLDVKKLKGTMWDVMSGVSSEADPAEVRKALPPEPLNFTSLYGQLMGRVSSSMARELSVPITFVCLLHLANEKTLSIVNHDGMGDLTIALPSSPSSLDNRKL